MTDKEFRHQIRNKPFKPLDTYTYGYSKIKFKCKIAGCIWESTGVYANQRGCPLCAGRHAKNFRQRWKDLNTHMGKKAPWYVEEQKDGRSKGETFIMEILDSLGIPYTREKTYKDLKGLGGGSLRYDFHIEELIEYDGIQHDRPVEYLGGSSKFDRLKQHDSIKENYAVRNGIWLERIKCDELIKKRLLDILDRFK